jgi:glycosyltransferase involved in cell wall biosynthesis
MGSIVMTDTLPLVSVITATYNRSNVLRYTIASLLRSTLTEWELLVIGDACTDDTEEVVASFDDPRIHFINLPKNFGEQSGPNNEGMRRARGRYIAFLNHDDLWFPDHLAKLVQSIEEHHADLVYALGIAITHVGKPDLKGATANGQYEPQVRVPASQWLFRRELVETVGYWRFARECYAAPSQDWLFRLWQAQKKIIQAPQVTVIEILSGNRNQVYLRREYSENEYYYHELLNNPSLLEQLLTQVSIDLSAQLSALTIFPGVKRIVRNLAYRVGLKFNQSPDAVNLFIYFRRKGGFIDALRRNRGLSKLE